jgi:hypothetical protein
VGYRFVGESTSLAPSSVTTRYGIAANKKSVDF